MNNLMYWITNNRKWIGWIGVPLVLVVLIWVGCTNSIELSNIGENIGKVDYWWGEWGDPILGVSTFLVAIVIWLLNMAKDWEDRLPNLLTVKYMLDGREVILCKNATLAHEGDIRNWGQTLGRQTVGKHVHFNLLQRFDVGKPDIHRSDVEGTKGKSYHKHYSAIFYLKNESGLKELKMGKFEFDARAPNAAPNKSNYIGPEIAPPENSVQVSFKPEHGVFKFMIDGQLRPDELENFIPDEAKVENFEGKGVVLSGKGPIWLYGYLVHYYHATKWVATYDPRLKGAVVVESHTPEVKVGDVIMI